jgi:hypothetical protein
MLRDDLPPNEFDLSRPDADDRITLGSREDYLRFLAEHPETKDPEKEYKAYVKETLALNDPEVEGLEELDDLKDPEDSDE